MTSRRAVILGAGAALAAPALAAGAQRLSDAACTRLADGRVRLAWNGGPADISVAERPDGPFDIRLAKGANLSWTGDVAINPRPYFRLAGRAGALEVAERLLPLRGGRNFRDMGGYRTADGRMVRWGRLYRSGAMNHLVEADYAYLSGLRIAVICDLRTNRERSLEPTVWAGAKGPPILSRDYEQPSAAAPGGAPRTAEEARATMFRVYETLAYDHAESYRRMFAELAAGHAPLAFNCSGGKDRTGMGAALLLTILGVPRDQVLADYALSDKLLDYEAIARATAADPASSSFGGMAALPADVRGPLMASDPAYLQAGLSAIARREGSIQAFVSNRLGVSAPQVRALRAQLLKSI